MVAAAGAGVFFYLSMRRYFGLFQSGLVLFLFFFAHDLLRASSHYTGVNVGLFFLGWSFFALSREKALQAMAVLGMSVMTGLYFAPAALGTLVWLWLKKRPLFLKSLAAFALTIILLNLLPLLWGGGDYLYQVYLYHLDKTASTSNKWNALASIALYNPLLLWGPVVAALAIYFKKPEPVQKQLLELAFYQLVAGALFLFFLGKLYHYYFLILFGPAAILGAYGYSEMLLAFFELRKLKTLAPKKKKTALRIALSLGLLSLAADGVREIGLQNQSWYKKQYGNQKTYSFKVAPLPAFLNGLVRHSLWSDIRDVGARAPGARVYLWHESRQFEILGKLREEVEKNMSQDDELFGDSSSAPLLALLTGHRLALNEADTNFMRFKKKQKVCRSFIERLEVTPPKLVLTRPRRGVFSNPLFNRWLNEKYESIFKIQDPYHGNFELFRRR